MFKVFVRAMGYSRNPDSATQDKPVISPVPFRTNDPAATFGRFVSHLTRSTFALVLAGGRGSRLMQLTDWRSKPAVPFGGKFRIVDFTLSNCVNSGIRRIGVATQYKSQSLIHHLQRGWSFLDGRLNEFIEDRKSVV